MSHLHLHRHLLSIFMALCTDRFDLFAAEYDVDDVSVEASGVDDGAREHGTGEPRQCSPPQLGNEDGTWALGQNEEMGTSRLQQEITDLAGQVNVLVDMVLEAKGLETDLQEAQERCMSEVAAVKKSIRSEAEACSKAVDQVNFCTIGQPECLPRSSDAW